MTKTIAIDTEEDVPLSEAARVTNVPAVTLRRWARQGSLPAWRHGHSGPWRVNIADVARLITTNRNRGVL